MFFVLMSRKIIEAEKMLTLDPIHYITLVQYCTVFYSKVRYYSIEEWIAVVDTKVYAKEKCWFVGRRTDTSASKQLEGVAAWLVERVTKLTFVANVNSRCCTAAAIVCSRSCTATLVKVMCALAHVNELQTYDLRQVSMIDFVCLELWLASINANTRNQGQCQTARTGL